MHDKQKRFQIMYTLIKAALFYIKVFIFNSRVWGMDEVQV